jgi:hypothetical protein
MRELPTIEMLHRLLICDAEAGKLFWRERTPDLFADSKEGAERSCAKWNARFAGAEAICSESASHGYLDGAIMGQGVLAHRVIWAMVHGHWPIEVDHINGCRRDNRIGNLRDVTRAENMRNLRRRSDNPSGDAGVWQLPGSGKWRARVKFAGVITDLGRFETREAAVDARKAACAAMGFHPNHGRAA